MADATLNREGGHRVTGGSSRLGEYLGISNPTELSALVMLGGLMLMLRIVNVLTWRFDTDEPQHLHVVWGWARGFVQYRDICDNHMPLFQLLFAPLYALIGDRPTILFWMRFLMFPIYGATAWATYRIGQSLYSRRVGIWAVVLAGLYPGYHYLALEFRTDNLWALFWLLSVAVLVGGRLTVRRASLAGLSMGACFGVSMKASLLLLSLAVGALGAGWFSRLARKDIRPPQLARCVAAFVGCALLIPGGITAGFASAGLWPHFRYWVFEHNLLRGTSNHPAWWFYSFPVLFPLLGWAIVSYVRGVSDKTLAARRGFVLLICGFYLPALWSYWSLVSSQDYLPVHPLAFVFYTAAALAMPDRAYSAGSAFGRLFQRLPLPAVVGLIELLICVLVRPPWENGAKTETDLLRATYRLTEPGDFVYDEKGETIFRQRAFAPAWESLFAERVARGLAVDDSAERCIQTHTCVATKGKHISEGAREFIERNYLSVGSSLYVAGKFLQAKPDGSGRFVFDVVIPAPYEIVSPGGPVAGSLDGSSYTGARQLMPGKHIFLQTAVPLRYPLAFIWAQAADRDFTPFRSSTSL